MTQETNNISSVLLELNKTLQVIGMEKLLELLKISRENDSNLGEEVKLKSQMVIQIVCDEFNIEIDDLNIYKLLLVSHIQGVSYLSILYPIFFGKFRVF